MLDVRFRVECNHYVDGTGYSLDACPRCHGVGHYYDLSFDTRGRIFTVEGSAKLVQELQKIALTVKGSNPFYPSQGTTFSTIGNVSLDSPFLKSRLSAEAIDVVSQLLALQYAESGVGRVFPDSELIHSIGTLSVQQDTTEPRRWRVFLEVLTESGKNVELSLRVKP